MRWTSFLGIVALLCAVPTTSASEGCLALSEITKIDRQELRDFGYDLRNDGVYFCSSTAPKQFECSCGASQFCDTRIDPFGRDLGECKCCATWVIVLLLLFVGMLGFSLLVAIYGCLCRGKWWCDGHPPPIVPTLARRGAPVVVPAQVPLPSNLFRGYRTSDFDSGLPPGALEAEAERRAARRRRREAERAARRRSERGTGDDEAVELLPGAAGSDDATATAATAAATAGGGGGGSETTEGVGSPAPLLTSAQRGSDSADDAETAAPPRAEYSPASGPAEAAALPPQHPHHDESGPPSRSPAQNLFPPPMSRQS